ncbi:hypothetical protein [Cytobacillus massiliigabonensis]|uniref:hypothetical protein n=1 Tax=Cytobacillus massiliigabonensis TaxID=1871011 RepID=UPI000C825527|nr:hypothetical protein [Cytobacillus massiliigabonensis]
MAVTDLYVDETLNYMRTLAKKAQVTIDGVEREYEIFKTLVEGRTVKHFVYLTNETGTITNAKLQDGQGRDLQHRTYNVRKGPDGFVVVFVITISIKEA